MKRTTSTGESADFQAFDFRLDTHSGVPVYRQLIDQVQAAIASGALGAGDQLPTVRRVTGTFIADRKVEYSKDERGRILGQLAGEFVSRAGAAGFTLKQLIKTLRELEPD
jgi:GntR family transcriptional regulator